MTAKRHSRLHVYDNAMILWGVHTVFGIIINQTDIKDASTLIQKEQRLQISEWIWWMGH